MYHVISHVKTFHRITAPLSCSFGSKCLCLTFRFTFLKSPACWIIWASIDTSWPKTSICTVTLPGALFTPCPHLSLACLNLTHPSRLGSSPVSTRKSFHFAKICFQFLYLPLTLWIRWHQVSKFLQRLGPMEGRPLCRSYLLFPVTLHRQQHTVFQTLLPSLTHSLASWGCLRSADPQPQTLLLVWSLLFPSASWCFATQLTKFSPSDFRFHPFSRFDRKSPETKLSSEGRDRLRTENLSRWRWASFLSDTGGREALVRHMILPYPTHILHTQQLVAVPSSLLFQCVTLAPTWLSEFPMAQAEISAHRYQHNKGFE